ncbi:unnamed protein product [Effrenium voratum]|uniref:SRCR domain-containing protein n=1 Tax=Effrenium voratum TaxID=2562239 RepID=A0AA36NAJ0_9DINO|nr:unnamed protein product [Effrenium voratum]
MRSYQLRHRWQAFGSSSTADEDHQSGEGRGPGRHRVWWDVPCGSRAGPAFPAAFPGNLAKLPAIWASGHQHATFRWVLSDLVTCDFSIEHLDSIFYSGHDLTTYVRGNDSDPSQALRLQFAFHEHAYLVISGHTSGSPCSSSSSSGFQASCTGDVGSSWEAFGASQALEERYKAGLGLDWTTPCASPSTGLPELGSSFWATGGSSAAFRWRRAELVSCSMTSDRVEAVYYDGMELTSTLTGDLLDFNSSKEFRFRHSQGAYLAITVRGDTGVCGRDAFHISCTNGVNSEGWEVFGSTGVVDATHRQGGGSGWTAPCASSWPATPGVRGVWAEGATEATFRWLDLESWELALKAEWEDGTFDYDSAVWHDGSKSTFGTGAALQNTKTEAYSQLKLTRVKLVIDRMAAIFTLPVDVRYRYTLQELSSALSSSVFRAALSQMGLEAETPGWSSGAVDHFRLGNAQHYCGAGFDLRNGPSVRLGVMLGDAGCTTLTGVEGLGLSASSDSLGSGLLGSQKAWGRVEVYVEGSPLREQELRLSEISEGRVEIFRSGRWGTVDDSAFDNLDAQVICRQLSFNGGMTLPTDEVLQSAQNGKAMANTSCVGYEPSLADCVSDAVEEVGQMQV